MNVTPDKEAPIIPKATIYHGEFLLALKKSELESFFPVILAITTRRKKYEKVSRRMCCPFNLINLYLCQSRSFKI
jgi:hypothetical protein